jgi:hypothetical protein
MRRTNSTNRWLPGRGLLSRVPCDFNNALVPKINLWSVRAICVTIDIGAGVRPLPLNPFFYKFRRNEDAILRVHSCPLPVEAAPRAETALAAPPSAPTGRGLGGGVLCGVVLVRAHRGWRRRQARLGRRRLPVRSDRGERDRAMDAHAPAYEPTASPCGARAIGLLLLLVAAGLTGVGWTGSNLISGVIIGVFVAALGAVGFRFFTLCSFQLWILQFEIIRADRSPGTFKSA